MRSEKSCGSIIFYINSDKIYYLLLYGPSYWGFVKGLTENSENEEETAIREAEEETGLDISFIEGFKEVLSYKYTFKNELIDKKAIFFLSEVHTQKIRLSEEHQDFKWVEFDEAVNLIRYPNQKDILRKANEFILTNLMINKKRK